MSTSAAPTVRRDADRSAYVLEWNGDEAGQLIFVAAGRILTLVHTEIDPQLADQHLGTQLVRAALDDIRTRRERIIARCPFVVAFLARHHEYDDLVYRDDTTGRTRNAGR